jgi:peptide/histidine transporter 3/4
MDITEIDERTLLNNYIGDGSISLSGRPVERSRTGVWKAAPFIYVLIFVDTISVLGIAGNLEPYAYGTLHLPLAEAVNTVTNFMGFTYLLPLIWGFLADSYFGRFWIIAVGSISTLSGLVVLTLSTSLPSLQPPSCTPTEENPDCPKASPYVLGWFYAALLLISFGSSGLKPCMLSLGQDQFDDTDIKEKKQGASFFTWYYVFLNIYSIFCVTVLFYIQSRSLLWGYGSIAAIYFLGISIFFLGTPFYRHRKPTSSTLTQAAQVFVAAFKNRNRRLPADPHELYEVDEDLKSNVQGTRKLVHTPKLRCLDKAAIVTVEERHERASKWVLCTVTQVEDLKCVVQIIPIWLCMILVFTLYAQVMGVGVHQASTLDLNLGIFTAAPGNAAVFLMLSGLAYVAIDKYFITPFLRRITSHPEGLSPLKKIGVAVFLAIMAMIVAANVEARRVRIYEESTRSDLEDMEVKVPMSVLWLIPQFTLLGFVEILLGVGQLHLLYRETPDSMRSLAISLTFTTIAVGYFVSTALVNTVNSYTASTGGWLADEFNTGGLKKYYYLLAVIMSVDLLIFTLFAQFYKYKELHPTSQAVDPEDQLLPPQVVALA